MQEMQIYSNKEYCWNPDDFTDAGKFLSTSHEKILKEYVNEKFKKNGTNMDVRATAIVKRMVESMSSVYKEEIKREHLGTVEPKDLDTVNSVLIMCEIYKNLCGTALIWMYNDEEQVYSIEKQGGNITKENTGVVKLKAVPAYKFSVELDGSVVKSVYVRYKEVYNQNNVQAWTWLKYSGGSVYESTRLYFQEPIPWTAVGYYDSMPFMLVQSESEDIAAVMTPFLTGEKSFVGGLALNRLSMAIGILRLLVATGANADDVAYMSEVVGNFTGIVGLPTTVAAVDSIDMGSTEQNKVYLETEKAELTMLAVQYGADFTALDKEDKIQSGLAKEIQKEYMNDVRVSNIPFWRTFEFKLWEWLWTREPQLFKPLVAIDFGTLTISLSSTELVARNKAEHDLMYEEVLTGLVSPEEYARWKYPEKTDQEIAVVVARVEARMV